MSLALIAVAVVANVVGAAMAVPQAVRLRRHRTAAGVSHAWIAMSVTVNLCWLAYGIGIGDPAILGISIVSVTVYSAALGTLWSLDERPIRAFAQHAGVPAIAIAAAPAIAFALGGWTAAGIVLGGAYGVQLSPAVVAVYRSADLSGVSTSTWMLALVEALLWGVYGHARSDPGLLSLGVVGTVLSLAVLVRLADHAGTGRQLRLAR